MASIGYVGLGTMGRGMVANLLKAGHDVTVWNRTPPDPADLAGVVIAESLADAVRGREIVMYCVSDDAAVRDVALGAAGIASAVERGTIVVDMSTISPKLSAEEAAVFTERGAHFLDAPVFGSKGEAAAGGLWVVMGGPADIVDRVRPVLAAVAATVHHMGPQGSGVRMKLVGNLVVAAQLAALGESLTLARAAGLDLTRVLEVLAVTDFRSPIFDGVGPKVIVGDYAPAFALDLMDKDARLVQDFAASVRVPVPGTDLVQNTLEEARKRGYGSLNASALIKVVAERAGVSLEA